MVPPTTQRDDIGPGTTHIQRPRAEVDDGRKDPGNQWHNFDVEELVRHTGADSRNQWRKGTHMARPADIEARGWMSINDLCQELGITRDTAYKWSSAGTESGRFPEFRKLPNGQIRIRRDWFEEWVSGLGPAA